MSKRGNGEGYISKRKDGRWVGAITVGKTYDGKQKRKTVYGKNRTEVRDKINQISRELATNTYREPPDIKVSEWMDIWLQQYKKIKLKPKTYDGYESLINTSINPSLGNLKLVHLKAKDIQYLYNRKYNDGNGISTNTLRRIHTVLKSALNQALINELIVKNPAIGVQLPVLNKREIIALNTVEQRKFLKCAEKYRLYGAFVVNFDTGLRMSEILALKWDDIDLQEGIIYVNKNLVLVKDRDSKNKKNKLLVQDSSKTKKSTRSIPLTERSLYILKTLKVKQQVISDIVFCSQTGGYVWPRNYERTFQKVVKKAKLKKCNTHTMRHTFATRLFERGVSAKTISELLGHSSVSFTLDTYAHVLPNNKIKAVRTLDRVRL